MTLELYGIPTCNTCKKAQQWLDQQGIAYTFINTKTHPPDRPTIAAWVAALGAKPLRNTSGQSYRALGADKQTWDDAAWIAAFSADAMLIKRPVWVRGGTAIAVGFRDPAAIHALLDTP
jgi:arsenate reductase